MCIRDRPLLAPISRALPDYRGTPGNLAAYVLTRAEGEITHFTTLTFWDSRESLVAFAGADIARAKYYPEDVAFLIAVSYTHLDVYKRQLHC